MKSDYAGFRPSVAVEVGVNAAVLYDNISFWCARNLHAGRHVIDGKAWTYNTYATYAALYPWMSEKMVRCAINLLEEKGYIISGYHSEDKRDRTKWYADALVGKAERPEGNSASAPQGNLYKEQLPTTAPTTVPSVLQTDTHDVRDRYGDLLQKDYVEDYFEKNIWSIYPRKVAKAAALKAWKAASKRETWGCITSHLEARIQFWKDSDTPVEYIPHLSTWLNQKRWNDPIESYNISSSKISDDELFAEVEQHLKEKYGNDEEPTVDPGRAVLPF